VDFWDKHFAVGGLLLGGIEKLLPCLVVDLSGLYNRRVVSGVRLDDLTLNLFGLSDKG